MKTQRISSARELSMFSFENTEREVSDHIYRNQLQKSAEFLKKNHHADVSRLQCLLRSMMPEEYYPLIDELAEDTFSHTAYSISGGNVQILPNATSAVQNIYEDGKEKKKSQ